MPGFAPRGQGPGCSSLVFPVAPLLFLLKDTETENAPSWVCWAATGDVSSLQIGSRLSGPSWCGHHSGSLPPSAPRCTLCNAPSESQPCSSCCLNIIHSGPKRTGVLHRVLLPPLLISTCRMGGTWDIVGIIVAGVAVDLSSGFIWGDRAHNVGLSRRVFRSCRWTWPYQMSAADKAQGTRPWRLLTAHSTWLCVSHPPLL